MTILWIYNMPLIPEAGGTERITSLVAKGLTERGYNCLGILVFDQKEGTMNYNGTTVVDLYAFLKEKKVDVVINQIAYDKWLLDSFLSKGGKWWQNEGGKIISCLHFDPCNPSTLFMVKSMGCTSLKDYIRLAKTYALHYRYEHIKRRKEGEIYRYVYDQSDKFVILSDSHRGYLHRVMGLDKYSKLVTINNPLTFPEIATKEDLDKKKNVVLVCARMSEYHKRISIILKVWKHLQKKGITDNWILKLVGEGPDLKRYKDYVQSNSLKNVDFCGRQNPLPYYKEASILLLTSSAEGWGLSITEALQNGVVPVVMNSSSVYGDMIEDGVNGYLTPNNDIASFSSSCQMLMENSKCLRSIQENALKSARRFQISNTIDKWEKIL